MSIFPPETPDSEVCGRPAAEARPIGPARPGALEARPLAAAACAFTAGAATGLLCTAPFMLCFGVGVVLGAAAVLRIRPRLTRPAFVIALFALLGMFRGLVAASPGPLDPSRWADGRYVDISGQVVGEPQRSRSGSGLILQAERIVRGDGSVIHTEGRIWAWLPAPDPLEGASPREEPSPGDLVTVHGRLELPQPTRNPGAFDERTFLAAKSIRAKLVCRRAADLRYLEPGSMPPVYALTVGARNSFVGATHRLLPPFEASLLSGIAFGARSEIPERLEDDFSRTGTVHVLATAGLHVGIVSWALMRLWRLLRISRRGAALLTIGFLAVYALAAFGRPAVSRATLMATVYLAAYLLDREPDGPSALGAAALCLLGWSPALLLDVGFQLSFVTVAVIFAVLRAAETWEEPGRHRSRFEIRARMSHWMRSLFLLSLAAQIGAAPLTAHHFHLFSPISLIANLLVVPAIFLLLVVSVALWPTAILAPALAAGVSDWIVRPLLWYCVRVVEMLSEVPGAAWSVTSPGSGGLLLIYAAIFAAAYLLVRPARRSAFDRPLIRPGSREDSDGS